MPAGSKKGSRKFLVKLARAMVETSRAIRRVPWTDRSFSRPQRPLRSMTQTILAPSVLIMIATPHNARPAQTAMPRTLTLMIAR